MAGYDWITPRDDLVDAPLGRRITPQDGDVVFRPDGTVSRVGDAPRVKKTKEVVPMSTVEAAAEKLKKALLEYAGIQSLMDRFHGVEPPIGTVIRWVKSYDRRSGEIVMEGVPVSGGSFGEGVRFSVKAPSEYVFLAFRAPDGKWYTTSRRGAVVTEWEALVKDIDDSPCELASEWTEVPLPEKLSEAALDPTEWAKTFFKKPAEKDAPSDDKAS